MLEARLFFDRSMSWDAPRYDRRALRTALSGVGIEISRRTVAKYRGELNIPAASARKKRA